MDLIIFRQIFGIAPARNIHKGEVHWGVNSLRELTRMSPQKRGLPSLKLTASSHLKIGRNPIGKLYSNHPFLGANC